MRRIKGMFAGVLAAAAVIGVLPGRIPACQDSAERARETESVAVPVLMYHNFAEEDGSYTVSAERFRDHLGALAEAGYETVTFAALSAYTAGEGDLPEKPVVLVSDDGYTGVLTYALPVLEEMDMVMSVAVIGDLLGVGGEGRLPHFSLEELTAADPEGRIEVISHSYGLHGVQEGMQGAVNLSRTDAAYRKLVLEDCGSMTALAEEYPGLGQVFVYPYGAWSAESEEILASAGYTVTVTTDRGVAQVSRGGTLTVLPRISAEWYDTGAALLRAVKP